MASGETTAIRLTRQLVIPVSVAAVLLASVLGSISSAIILTAAVIGLVGIAIDRSHLELPRPVWWTAVAFAAFFLAELLSGVVNWNGQPTLIEIGENFTFFALIPLYALLMIPRRQLLAAVLRAAPWCAFAVLALALYQRFGYTFRPQGGAGNAGVFAVTVGILLAYTLANFFDDEQKPWQRFVAIAGVAAAAAALILSGTRALWPALVILPILMWLAIARIALPSRRMVVMALIVVVVISGALAGTIRDAYQRAVSDIQVSQAGNYETSLGKRYVIWQAALDAIPERPILGFGPDSPRRIMEERTIKLTGVQVNYSHFHDIVLNEMARAGIVGTLALFSMLLVPLYLCFRAPRDRTGAFGFGLLISIQCAFLLSGTVNIMLDHDILDTQFVANTALCLFLVFGRKDEGPAQP